MTRRIVVTNVFGPLNRGDEELFGRLLSSLPAGSAITAFARDAESCSRLWPDVDFVEQPGRRDSRLLVIPAAIARCGFLFVFLVAGRWPRVAWLLPPSQRRAPSALRDADLIVACPGGYLEDSRWSLYSQLVQLLAATLSSAPVVLAPMSIGPVNSKLGRSLLGGILKRADRVYVRELESRDFVRALGCNCDVSPDLALEGIGEEFSDDPPDRPGYYVVTLLRWAFPRAPSPEEAKQRYVENAVRLVELLTLSGADVVLMVQVGGDRSVVDQVASLCRSKPSIVEPRSPAEAREIISGALGMVASRLHSGIFALQVGTPVTFLGYLPKSRGVLRLLGLEDLVDEIEDFVPEVVALKLCTIASDRAKFRSRLLAPGERSRERFEAGFLSILDDIESAQFESAGVEC